MREIGPDGRKQKVGLSFGKRLVGGVIGAWMMYCAYIYNYSDNLSAGSDKEQIRGAATRNAEILESLIAKQNREHIVVIGGGVMGSSTAWSLARKGSKVTIVDAGHAIRGSWGESRIGRLAYADVFYVNMMKRAYELWDELAQESGKELYRDTGIVDAGISPALDGLRDTYNAMELKFDELTAEQCNKRFPQFRLPESECAIYQENASVIFASRCVNAFWNMAEQNGARTICDDAVQAIDVETKTIKTESGQEIKYDKLVLCAGAWTNKLLKKADLPILPIVASNEQQVYFEPKDEEDTQYDDDECPIFLYRQNVPSIKDTGEYVEPHVRGGISGIKMGWHRKGDLLKNDEFVVKEGLDTTHLTQDVWAETFDTTVNLTHLRHCQEWLKKYMPGIDPEKAKLFNRCIYVNGPDEDFIMGQHPGNKDVFVMTGFTGEGFKFSPTLGEALADTVLGADEEQVPGMRERFTVQRLF